MSTVRKRARSDDNDSEEFDGAAKGDPSHEVSLAMLARMPELTQYKRDKRGRRGGVSIAPDNDGWVDALADVWGGSNVGSISSSSAAHAGASALSSAGQAPGNSADESVGAGGASASSSAQPPDSSNVSVSQHGLGADTALAGAAMPRAPLEDAADCEDEGEGEASEGVPAADGAECELKEGVQPDSDLEAAASGHEATGQVGSRGGARAEGSEVVDQGKLSSHDESPQDDDAEDR